MPSYFEVSQKLSWELLSLEGASQHQALPPKMMAKELKFLPIHTMLMMMLLLLMLMLMLLFCCFVVVVVVVVVDVVVVVAVVVVVGCWLLVVGWCFVVVVVGGGGGGCCCCCRGVEFLARERQFYTQPAAFSCKRSWLAAFNRWPAAVLFDKTRL